MKTHIWTLAATLLFSTSCLADIVNCNGEWTNKPCVSGATDRFVEKPVDAVVSDKDYPEKKQILASASSYGLELSKLGLTFPVESISTFCLKTETSVEKCRDNFEKTRDSFSKSVEAAQVRVSNDRSSKERDASDKVSPPPSSSGSTSVTVIDNTVREPYVLRPGENLPDSRPTIDTARPPSNRPDFGTHHDSGRGNPERGDRNRDGRGYFHHGPDGYRVPAPPNNKAGNSGFMSTFPDQETPDASKSQRP